MLATIQSGLNFMFYSGRGARRRPKAARLRKRERRTRVMTMGRLYFSRYHRRAVVRNMSLNGLMLETTLPPAEGEPVVVNIEGLPPLQGEVRWRTGGNAGIRFAEPITPEQLFECAIRGRVANDGLRQGTRVRRS